MPGDDTNTVNSDGTWSYINKQDNVSIYHPLPFIKAWNKVSSVQIDASKFTGLSSYNFNYDEVVEKFIEEEKRTKDLSSEDAEMDKFLRGLSDDNIRYKIPVSNWKGNFEKLYKNKMMEKNESLKKEFMDFFNFQRTMWVNNRIYTPMYSGPQCGDPQAQLKLANKMCEITKQSKERGY